MFGLEVSANKRTPIPGYPCSPHRVTLPAAVFGLNGECSEKNFAFAFEGGVPKQPAKPGRRMGIGSRLAKRLFLLSRSAEWVVGEKHPCSIGPSARGSNSKRVPCWAKLQGRARMLPWASKNSRRWSLPASTQADLLSSRAAGSQMPPHGAACGRAAILCASAFDDRKKPQHFTHGPHSIHHPIQSVTGSPLPLWRAAHTNASQRSTCSASNLHQTWLDFDRAGHAQPCQVLHFAPGQGHASGISGDRSSELD